MTNENSIETTKSREHIVNTAIKFLQNPKVRLTSLSNKKSFLSSKGLSDIEIERACTESGAYLDEENNKSQLSSVLISPQLPPQLPPPPSPQLSFWVKARETANLIAVLSLGSYSLYLLWTRFLRPKLFPSSKTTKTHSQTEELLRSVTALNEQILELKHMIAVSKNGRVRENEIEELREEMRSIKTLLLNRSQFPSVSGIPAWQLVEKNKSERGEQEEEADEKFECSSQNSCVLVRKNSSEEGGGRGLVHSGSSSCEVVFLKNDSSDPDQSSDD